MGTFAAKVVAVGGHGCEREKGDGANVVGCERSGCPDCITREYVRRLKRSGASVELAELIHWPPDVGALKGQPFEGQVKDDLLTGLRTGSF